MPYFISFCENWQRVIPMCIIEDRANIPAIKNEPGTVVKAYIDSQLALITGNVLVYRVESENCNLAGFFALEVNTGDKSCQKIMEILRPAFQGNSEISELIITFINENQWFGDFLFGNQPQT